LSNDIISHMNNIISMIVKAKENTLISINTELIKLYWNVGEYLYNECTRSSWGDAFIDTLADQIKENYPEIKGFNRRGLYRMRQFFETYKDNKFVSPLVTQISWSNHLLILSGAKTIEEKEFYINLCLKEKYSKRELERQIDSAYFQRYILSEKKLEPVQIEKRTKSHFMDTYILEFLDLPKNYTEKEFQKAIIHNLKDFILEIGKDFSFIGEEFRVQVANNDYSIDLLFYHRGLSCLVAFELKIDKFKPEYLGKMNFYLEALDRDVKKPNENPSIGVILCASKENEVVEYAMSRNISPTMISEYNLKLIDKKILEQKLREYKELLPDNHNEIQDV